MNLLTTQYVHHLQRLEIYLAGCKGVNGVHCKGCHNPQSWSFKAGKELDYAKLVEKCKTPIVQNIWVLGGEPLDQKHCDLTYLLFELMSTGKPVWLFTRYDLAEIPESILDYVDYIKAGAYREDLKPVEQERWLGLSLASTNQHFYKKYKGEWLETL